MKNLDDRLLAHKLGNQQKLLASQSGGLERYQDWAI